MKSSTGGKQRSSERKRKIEQEKKRESLMGLSIVIIIVAVLGVGAWYYLSPLLSASSPTTTAGGDPTLTTCVDEGALAMHIHIQLRIIVNGRDVPIPPNTGITPTCTRPVHTHDDTGQIHIESPVVYRFTLKDLFLVWSQPFDSTQVLQYKVDATHSLKMTVNGAPSTQFQNYVFHDGDTVIIIYGPQS